jgi:NADH-quinone oxidoreductase E subunit
MSHFTSDIAKRADDLVLLYPVKRSAMLPMLHLAQEQDGYLSDEGIAEVASRLGLSEADVRGTAAFYEMFHLEPVGKYVVGICTNVACLLAGGEELLEHAEKKLGCAVGRTSPDGLFTLEETECLADCNIAPVVQVNHRFVRTTTAEAFDQMIDEVRGGKREADIPPHGTLIRVRRSVGLKAPREEVVSQRATALKAREARVAQEQK